MTLWGISSVGRAPALHAGGQEFEPPILHHLYLENWIKYQIVYKQVNNENEIEKLETKLESKVKMGNKYNFEINL